jgi:hypothetical protein
VDEFRPGRLIAEVHEKRPAGTSPPAGHVPNENPIMAERPKKRKDFSPEDVLRLILRMPKIERYCLGELLSREDNALPYWKVIPARRAHLICVQGLRGAQALLYRCADTGPHRENDILRIIWPDAARRSPNLSTDKRLKNRLRKLQFDTNYNLDLFRAECRIRRNRRRHELFLLKIEN